MAWVRIHDAALSHPKLVGLIDWRNPFCLWVWGLSYCQTHLTDGLIPAAAMPYQQARKAIARLVLAGLWDAQDDGGWRVHDYLDWNDSRNLVLKKRTEAKERMSNARQRSSPDVRANFYVARAQSGVVLDPGSSEGVQGKPETDPAEALRLRAGELLQRYGELFHQHRKGARYHARPALDFPKACELVRTWTDDARLEKLAVLILTTDDEWIARTDRGFAVFAARASWADDRLTAWEIEHKVTA